MFLTSHREGRSAAPAVHGRLDQGRLLIAMLLLTLCIFLGGGSRSDSLSLLVLRPAVILLMACFVLLPGPWRFKWLEQPLVLLGGLAAIMLLQLIPLPPVVWSNAGGREQFLQAALAMGIDQPWRPLSLTPELTINSLLALIVPAATLLMMCGLPAEHRELLLPCLIAAICLSAAVGVGQLASGGSGWLYFHRVTHEGYSVGFFANKNHQAAFLALTFPLLRAWEALPSRSERFKEARTVFCAAVAVAAVASLLTTGSRAGIVLGFLGIVSAYFIAPIQMGSSRVWRVRKMPALIAAAAGVLVVGFVTVYSGRALSMQRLSSEDIGADLRAKHLPTMLDIARDFMPFGSGFGSFDPVFRIYEKDHELGHLYFNKAHNDLIEVLITGGAPALLILSAFLVWYTRKALKLYWSDGALSSDLLLARAGAVVMILLLLASLVDYPLRTPSLAAVFAVACGWFCQSCVRSLRAAV